MQRDLLQNMIFQQDEVPLHYTREVEDLMDAEVPNYSIGRNDPAI